jgi:PAS domain S-box-containing protein
MRAGKRERPSANDAITGALAALAALPGLKDDPIGAEALATIAAHVDAAEFAKIKRLTHAAQIVNSSLEVDAVLRDALELAVELVGAERGFLMLDEGRHVVAVHNLFSFQAALNPEALPKGLVERAFETGEAVFTTDAQSDPQWRAQSSVVALHIRSIACVPMRVRDRVLGVIYLDSRVKPGLFTPADRELLTSFAHQSALAIENARHFEGERQRAQRVSDLQAFQDRLLEAIANGVITLDGAGRITSFNRAAETTFGLNSEDVTGGGIATLARAIPDFAELIETYYASGGVLLRAEVEARRPDGAELTMQLRFTPLETPEEKGVAVVVTDVTEQRRLEATHAAELAHKNAIQESFSRYLAPHVLQSLVANPSSVQLGGERCHATMLFADIRGFTKLAAELEPERVAEILNTYFEEAVRIIFEFDGLLDKFYGDGLMAVFGAPLARPDDAKRALGAALRLRDAMRDGLKTRGSDPLAISIGLASGDVVAGHFGSSLRMDYTVIGDAVNLAQGLQSAAPAGAVYLDEATYLAAQPEGRFHRIAARVKGRSELVAAYAVLPEELLAPNVS